MNSSTTAFFRDEKNVERRRLNKYLQQKQLTDSCVIGLIKSVSAFTQNI